MKQGTALSDLGHASGSCNWATLVGHVSGTCKWDMQAEHASGPYKWDMQVGHASGTFNWDMQEMVNYHTPLLMFENKCVCICAVALAKISV